MVLFLSATALFAQSADTRPAYEAASLKLNTSVSRGSDIDGSKGQIVFKNVTLERLIELANSVGPHRVTGPDWLASVRVDISAKYPPDAKSAERWLMLRTLLEDRFKLAVHRETKEMPGYALVAAKSGFKLKPAESGENDTETRGGRVKTLTAKSTSIAWLADEVARYTGTVVVDKTGIAGVFDFELRWATPNWQTHDPEGDRGVDTPTLPIALEETLGLRLQAQKVPVEVIVVDHSERVPTEN